ncbi:MAG: glycosyltransferase 9 family protein [Herminiimonas sp.]|nr:glycosyltransferase 9 family protein [Herminiimonas sp.]
MMLDNSHVLISRTDNIGDVVLTLPLAGYLKRRFPSMKIGFICRGYAAAVVRYCRAIDYMVEIEKLDDPASYLADSDVDTIIFSKPDRRLAAAAKKARIPNRVGTSHRLFNWLYCNRLAHFSRVKSSLHEAQLNFELLRPLGIDFIPELDEIPALYQLGAPPAEPVRAHLPDNQFNLVIHPKSNGNGREWPIGHYAELARMLRGDHDIHLWITGSEREGEWIRQHAADLAGMPNVTDLCGRFSLDELTAFINAANGLIASGTGPLHISAALGKPTLGLFPPMRPIDPGRWGALGAKAEVLCQDQVCGGCKDPATCACMRSITPGQVSEIVLKWKKNSIADKALS